MPDAWSTALWALFRGVGSFGVDGSSTSTFLLGARVPSPPFLVPTSPIVERSPRLDDEFVLDVASTTFAVVDLETTGLSPERDRIVEFTVWRCDAAGSVSEKVTSVLDPGRSVGPSHIHGISQSDVRAAPRFADVADVVCDVLSNAVVVAHNASFESRFLREALRAAGRSVVPVPCVDTLTFARRYLCLDNHRLATCCDHLGISLRDAHTATDDVTATVELLAALLAREGIVALRSPVPMSRLGSTGDRSLLRPRAFAQSVVPPAGPGLLLPTGTMTASQARAARAAAAGPVSSTAVPAVAPPSVAPPSAVSPLPRPAASQVSRHHAEQVPVEPLRFPTAAASDVVAEFVATSAPLRPLTDRFERSWRTTYTRVGGWHPKSDPASVPAGLRDGLANVAVSATAPTRAGVSSDLSWLCSAALAVLQRGRLPLVPAAADLPVPSPDLVLAALAEIRGPATFDVSGLHEAFEQPFVELLAEQFPELAAWCVPQVPLASLCPADGDRYVDFVVVAPWAAPFVIELDGSQHAAERALDDDRDMLLTAAGWGVLRVDGAQVADPQSLLWRHLHDVAAACPAPVAPAGSSPVAPLSPDVAAVAAPAQLNRFLFAFCTAAARGWFRGDCWTVDLSDDLEVCAPHRVAEMLSVLAALDHLWGLGVLPSTVVVNSRQFVREGPRFVAAGSVDGLPQVELRLEFRRSAHEPFDVTSGVPVVLVRSSAPVVEHSWLPVAVRDRLPDLGAAPEALDVLTSLFAVPALRDEQRSAVLSVLSGRDVVAVLPTGFGKSLVYQMAGVLRGGVCVVVDPINALIDDQVRRMEALGCDRAVGVSSSRQPDRRSRAAALDAVAAGAHTFVFCSPERLFLDGFRSALRSAASATGVGCCVIDEAHCVSEWGHDFRPTYLRVAALLRRFTVPSSGGRLPPLVAMTGTASPAVLDDVCNEIGVDGSAVLSVDSFVRPNLNFGVNSTGGDRVSRLRQVLTVDVPATLGLGPSDVFDCSGRVAGIVFVPHVNGEFGLDAVRADVLEALARSGLSARVGTYAGARPRSAPRDWDQVRARTAAEFTAGRLDVLVATKSFGMGVDAPQVRFTVHVGVPSSVEAFAQEAGRAGRVPSEQAACWLISDVPASESRAAIPALRRASRDDDVSRQRFFLNSSFPGRAPETAAALGLLDDALTASRQADGASTVRVPLVTPQVSQALRLRAVHRLVVLGVLNDFSVEFGASALRLRLGAPNVDQLDAAFLEWVSRIGDGRAVPVRSSLRGAPSDPVMRARFLVGRVVDVVYDVVEPSRRQALAEMCDLAVTASSADEVSERIASFLSGGSVSAALSATLSAEPFAVPAALRRMSALPASSSGEWLMATRSRHADGTGHPLVAAVSVLAAALPSTETFAHPAASVESPRTVSGASSSPQQSPPDLHRRCYELFDSCRRHCWGDIDTARVVSWLLAEFRRRSGTDASAPVVLVDAFLSAGFDAALLAPDRARVLAAAAAGNAELAELPLLDLVAAT